MKDVLEAMGIPHTEVDLILVTGMRRICVEPLTRQYYDDFSRCSECGRIYWPGSHRARLVSFVEGLRNQL